MKCPKILLTGGTGQLGHELLTTLKLLGQVWAPNRQEFDLAHPKSLQEKILDYQPSLIVNSAAYTAVDQAEFEPELAHTINAKAPKILAEGCHKLGIPLIHYSTDYVFDGTKTEPYVEEDAPNPLNVYGKTKLEGEHAIEDTHDQYLILRTSWVYNQTHGKNFYRTMLRLFQNKEEVHVVNDQMGAPTSAIFLAEKTTEILIQLNTKEQSEKRWGVYHITESEVMSWYEFAKKIFDVETKESTLMTKSIIQIPSSEYLLSAKRPLNNVLNTYKINSVFQK